MTHLISWRHDGDTIVGDVLCLEVPQNGAPCRLECRYPECVETNLGSFEHDDGGWYHLVPGKVSDEKHRLHAVPCLIIDGIYAYGGPAEFYGGIDTQVRNGPIEPFWENDELYWKYADDR